MLDAMDAPLPERMDLPLESTSSCEHYGGERPVAALRDPRSAHHSRIARGERHFNQVDPLRDGGGVASRSPDCVAVQGA